MKSSAFLRQASATFFEDLGDGWVQLSHEISPKIKIFRLLEFFFYWPHKPSLQEAFNFAAASMGEQAIIYGPIGHGKSMGFIVARPEDFATNSPTLSCPIDNSARLSERFVLLYTERSTLEKSYSVCAWRDSVTFSRGDLANTYEEGLISNGIHIECGLFLEMGDELFEQCVQSSMYDLRWSTIDIFFALCDLAEWNCVSKIKVSFVCEAIRGDRFEQTAFFSVFGVLYKEYALPASSRNFCTSSGIEVLPVFRSFSRLSIPRLSKRSAALRSS